MAYTFVLLWKHNNIIFVVLGNTDTTPDSRCCTSLDGCLFSFLSKKNLPFPPVPEMREVLVIISIIFEYPFPQNRTGISCMKIFGLSSTGFQFMALLQVRHFCPCLTSNLWEVPLKSMGLLMCSKLRACVSALLDWCRTKTTWLVRGLEQVLEKNLRKVVAIDLVLKWKRMY